jgi:hypothetical protein
MSDAIQNPGGLPLSAGQVQAAIEAAVRREHERYRRLHGRPAVGAYYPLLPHPRASYADEQDLVVPPPREVTLTGLVRSMVRLAQRMHDERWGAHAGPTG